MPHCALDTESDTSNVVLIVVEREEKLTLVLPPASSDRFSTNRESSVVSIHCSDCTSIVGSVFYVFSFVNKLFSLKKSIDKNLMST